MKESKVKAFTIKLWLELSSLITLAIKLCPYTETESTLYFNYPFSLGQ